MQNLNLFEVFVVSVYRTSKLNLTNCYKGLSDIIKNLKIAINFDFIIYRLQKMFNLNKETCVRTLT